MQPTPEERERIVKFPKKPSTVSIIAGALHDANWSFILLLTTLFANILSEESGKLIFVVGAIMNASIMGLACALFYDSDEAAGTTNWTYLLWATCMDFFVGIAAVVGERYFVYCILAYGVDTIILAVMDYHSGARSHLFCHLFDGSIMIGIALHAILGHQFVRLRAMELLRPDLTHYETIWSALVKDEQHLQCLKELEAFCLQLSTKISGDARQYSRQRPDCAHYCCQTCLSGIIPCHRCPCNIRKSGLPGKPGTVDRTAPIYSLDQLYFQTVALHPLLLNKVKEWALQCRGCFPVLANETNPGRPEFVQWCHLQDDPARVKAVKWAMIKSEERAIEKLARSYDGDVSRLVDLTRQAIILEDLRDLVSAVKLITSDSEIVVERVKNRMDLRHDPVTNGGYRDVLLNFRIVTEQAMFLGLETHVVELQLILKLYAEKKSDEGHRRYVEYRNARGE